MGITNVGELNQQANTRIKDLSQLAARYQGTDQGIIYRTQAQNLQKAAADFEALADKQINRQAEFVNQTSFIRSQMSQSTNHLDDWAKQQADLKQQLKDLGVNYPTAKNIRLNSDLASEWVKAHMSGQGVDQVASIEQGNKDYRRFLNGGHFSDDGKTYYNSKNTAYDLTDPKARRNALLSANTSIANNTGS